MSETVGIIKWYLVQGNGLTILMDYTYSGVISIVAGIAFMYDMRPGVIIAASNVTPNISLADRGYLQTRMITIIPMQYNWKSTAKYLEH